MVYLSKIIILLKYSNEDLIVKLMHINPRIVNTRYLFGFHDENSNNKFVEGVISKIIKSYQDEVLENPEKDFSYVVTLDNLIDSSWTEVVESVLVTILNYS